MVLGAEFSPRMTFIGRIFCHVPKCGEDNSIHAIDVNTEQAKTSIDLISCRAPECHPEVVALMANSQVPRSMKCWKTTLEFGHVTCSRQGRNSSPWVAVKSVAMVKEDVRALDKLAEPWLKSSEYYASKGIVCEQRYIQNSRGMKLFASRWIPADKPPRAIVFLLHGYAVDCGIFWGGTGETLAEAGFASFGLDYEGHGRSDGMRAFIKDVDLIVQDCIDYARTITGEEPYKSLPRFLHGESMGAAIALLIERKEPGVWTGMVLLAPMVKIGEALKPPRIIIMVLKALAHMLPTWQLVPSRDVASIAARDPEKRARIDSMPFMYHGKPRLGTAVSLLHVCEFLESHLHEVSLPFLLLHGAADLVTEPTCSQDLFDLACSNDKTFKLYPDMWHSLIDGESDENVAIVFKDIIKWLNDRSLPGLSDERTSVS